MSAAVEIDLDDTADCPVAARCEGRDCGASEDLAVATVETFAGVSCLTLCASCVTGPLPTFAPLDALTRAGRHCEHLGIDLDVMAELVDALAGER